MKPGKSRPNAPPSESSSVVPFVIVGVLVAGAAIGGWRWKVSHGTVASPARSAKVAIRDDDDATTEEATRGVHNLPSGREEFRSHEPNAAELVVGEPSLVARSGNPQGAATDPSPGEPPPPELALPVGHALRGADDGPPLSATGRPLEPMPVPGTKDDGGGDALGHYVQDRIREDMLPLARSCYDNARAANPASAGKVMMFFKVVSDGHGGGVVQAARVDDEQSTLHDAEFARCISESLTSLRFGDVAPGFGEASIQYPLSFSAGDGG